MSKKALKLLKKKMGEAILDTSNFRGDETAVVNAENILEVCQLLKDDEKLLFDMPIDVTCVDYLKYPEEKQHRFEVVYHFRSSKHNHRIRLKVPLEGDSPELDSVTSVWRGVNWFEREVFDMFGVRFKGHPNLKRILLYEEFQGHPLRKDYPLKGHQPLIPMPNIKKDKLPSDLFDAGKDGK